MDEINATDARRIESLTEDILRKYEALTRSVLSPPVPVFDIARRLFALRCDVENLKGSLADASGVLIPGKRWILLNKRQASTRLSFTLAHELGHWLIDRQPISNTADAATYLASLRQRDPRMREITADHFAGALLMPKHILMNEIAASYAPHDPDKSALAATFGVSTQALEARLRVLEHERRHWSSRWVSSEVPHRDARHFGFRSANTRLERPRLGMVKVDCPVIDHDLYRRLRSLRADCRCLLLVLNCQDDPNNGSVTDLNCVDGCVHLEDAQFDDLETITSHCPDSDVLLHRIVSGEWLEPLVREAADSGFICGSAYVAFPRSDDHTELIKRSLLDIGSYVAPAVPLRYRHDARMFVRAAKARGERVAIVTGCFDLVTKEHVRFLKAAKEAGDILVVGIEDDTRVRAFKGRFRPVNTISQRVEVVSALRFVDFVFVISGSPRLPIKPFYSRLHRTIGADVLVITEGDQHLEDRRDEIEAAGGQLLVTPRLGDGSSTSLLAMILAPTEYSDLRLISKANPRSHEAEHRSNWRQLGLPIDGFH
jgi:cytidyltransferase-like protein